MNSHIDPLILQKLQAFSQRRRKLIIRRGIYAAVATLLAAMMLVAFIDWLFVLPDGVRWALSGAAYLSIIIVEWRSCWRLLLSAPGPRKLARLVEHAEPKLREDLLSAVELGETKPGTVFDSEQFRALVQSDVAARVAKLDVDQLLPAHLVRRYIFIASGIGLACLVAFALTGFQFGTLMMRALLPMANFARVSKVHVRIVEPTPAEMRVPQGDTLPLVIELSGQRTTKAYLETFTPSGGRELVPMTPADNDRFSATIQVGRENVYYRVRAGDALTKKYQLEAVARPAIVEFEKSYTYPAYARLAPKVVKEENGDITGLEGSEVVLRLKANQKVRDAELRLEQGKQTTAVPLTVEGDSLVARLPLTTSGVYRVHLVGAESGFENKFSPEYELRAEPDLLPQVELELPKQDLILPSNEIVDVRGTASDDLALAKVAQLVKINDGGWKETPLAQNSGAEATVERRWDLFEQGVKPGDLVTMKLVATDLKGNKAESRPLQVTITSTGFEVKRLQALTGWRKLYEALMAQHATSVTLARLANEARKDFEKLPEGDGQRTQVLQAPSATLKEALQKNTAATQQLTETLREAVPGHQTADLALIGHLLARIGTNYGMDAQTLYEAVSTHPEMAAARDLQREAADAANRFEQRAKRVADLMRIGLTAEEIDVFNENLQVVGQEAERITGLAHRSGTDPARWVPVASRLRVVLSEMRGLEELAGAVIEHGARWAPDRMRNLQKTLNKHRAAMEKALAAPPSGDLLSPTLEMARAVNDASREALNIRRDYRGVTGEGVRDLLRETEPAYAMFEQLRQETHRYFRNDRIPVEIGNALIEARWSAGAGLLKARGDVEEWRPDADTTYIADVRLTTRVMQALSERAIEEKPENSGKDLQGIDERFRVLEYGHEVAELHGVMAHLAVEERWEIYDPKSRTANPQEWGWIVERLRSLPDELGKALKKNEDRTLAQAVQKILREAPNQPFSQALNREMEERFNPDRNPTSARENADLLAAYLQQAVNLFRQPMEEARKELARLAPTLADTMKQLAKKTEDLKGQTTNQAQQAHEKLPDEAKADARQTLAQQQRLNEKVEGLKDALRADANQQNILEAEGRERARDADDALAMLKESPVRAEEDLARAAKSDQAAAQEEALSQAAQQQDKMAKALEQMAEHYAAMEQGKPEETRLAMRATEAENGIKEQLDQQFARAEELAKMAQSTPEELLAQLEKALPKNPLMQQELSSISQSTLKSAAEQLKQASEQEKAVAQNVQKMADDERAQAAVNPTTPDNAAQNAANPAQQPADAHMANVPKPSTPDGQPAANAPKENSPAMNAANPPPAATPDGQPVPAQANPMLAQAAQQQSPIAQNAAEAASEIARAGRHEERMQNPIAGQQLQQLGAQLQQTAEKQVPNAQQALQQAQQAMQAQPAVSTANQELQKSFGDLMAAVNPGEANAAESAAPPTGSPPDSAPTGQVPATPGQSPAPTAASSQASQMAQANSPSNNTNPPASAPPDGAPPSPPSGSQPVQPTPRNPSQAQAAASPSGKMAGRPGNAPASSQAAANPGESAAAGEMAAAPVSPQEQVWMARTLDALDAAFNAPASSQNQTAQAGQDGAPQNAQASGNTSQAQQTSAAQGADGKPAPQSSAMGQAQSAMSAAAQAAAAAARQARTESGSPSQQGQPQPGGLQAISKGGAQLAENGGPHGGLTEAKNKAGDWGKLPKQMAEELTQGQREGIAGEYRNQVETYYRVIAEKSKKQ